ncbi:MAG TPA: rhodanese-like domain-containing protein [Chloroflexi bacterium]|nr:rhodanese-like domain-containing protein [Chloroflexota bacterium]
MNFFKKLFAPVPALSAAEARERLREKPKPFLLDARTSSEYREGHIPGAALIPLHELDGRMRKLPKNREIICVCRSGNRSRRAAKQLLAAGYTAVNLKGGMRAWNKAGYKIKKGKAR